MFEEWIHPQPKEYRPQSKYEKKIWEDFESSQQQNLGSRVLFQHDNLQKYTLAFWSAHSPALNPILRGEDQEPCQKMVKSGEV